MALNTGFSLRDTIALACMFQGESRHGIFTIVLLLFFFHFYSLIILLIIHVHAYVFAPFKNKRN